MTNAMDRKIKDLHEFQKTNNPHTIYWWLDETRWNALLDPDYDRNPFVNAWWEYIALLGLSRNDYPLFYDPKECFLTRHPWIRLVTRDPETYKPGVSK